MSGHLCLFYTQPDELWAQCERLIVASEPQTQWLYLADEHATALVAQKLGGMGVGEVIDSAETDFRATQIRIGPLVSRLTERIKSTLTHSAAVLLFVEMSWAIRTPSGAVYLREYEAAIAELTAQLPLTAVCLYNQQIMLDRQLMIGLHTHRDLLVTDSVVRNPYFVPPDIFTSRNMRSQFEHWLHELAPPAPSATTLLTPSSTNIANYNLEEEPTLVARTSDEKRWKIRCFGGLRVYRADGATIQWNVVSGATRKTKTLFAFLLFRGEAGATAEEIADLLWPDSAESKQSLNRMYHTVRCLRMALSPELTASRQSPFVLREDQRYFLALPQHSWLDLPMFQELCYRGRALMKQQNWDEALICYQSAERLYTGDLLADIPEKYAANREIDWCWSRRYWYKEMYVKVLVNSAEIHRQLNNIPDALAQCDKALKLDPINESAHQEKMRALAAVNRRDALERQFRLYKNVLKQLEIGQPSQTTKTLFSQLLSDLNG